MPATLLSVFAGGAAAAQTARLSTSNYWGMAIFVATQLAAGLTALQTFFRDADRSGRHRLTAAGYAAVRRLASLALVLPATSPAEAKQTADSIRELFDQLSRDAPELPSDLLRKYGVPT